MQGLARTIAGATILCALSSTVAADDQGSKRRHRIEAGNGVPICVWGQSFVSTCGLGGADFHGAYIYRLHRRFGVGAFVNAGVVIAVDMGVIWRTWLVPELLYVDFKATAMAPRGVSIDHIWFYGFETAVGSSLPAQGRVRFILEAEVMFLFNEFGYIGFFRPMMGLVVTL